MRSLLVSLLLLAFAQCAQAQTFVGWVGVPLLDETPPPAQVTVPDVIGDDEATATTAIEAEGLVVSAQTKCSAVMAGDVFAQSPIGGTMVDAGSTVTIQVSSGVLCSGSPWLWLRLELDL